MPDFEAPPAPQSAPAADAPPTPPFDERARRSALFVVFLVVVIDLLGFGLVLPLLPRYGREFIPGGETSPWTGPILGGLMASFSLMQFIFAPIWGRVSDRIGRRPILLLGLFSSVVFYTLFGWASLLGREGWREIGLLLLFASRIGAGIAGATLGTAQAAIADCTSAQDRSRGMALIGAGFGIGFTFGPLMGFAALVYAPGYAAGPGFVAAGFSLIALLIGLARLPETHRASGTGHRRKWFDRQGWRTALRTPSVGVLILIFFLATLAFANFEPTLAFLTLSLGLDDRNNLLVFAYVGLVLSISQGGLYRPLSRRMNEITLTWIGTVLMVVGLAGLGVIAVFSAQVSAAKGQEVLATLGSSPEAAFPANLPWAALYLTAEPIPQSGTLFTSLYVILAIAVTGFSFMTPSVQALISRRSDPNKQGEILGVNQSASAMARILGPALGVPLYYLTPSHYLPYAFGTGLLVLVLLLAARLRKS
jgi:DHA1 family tetracycline resistance protein-like MFS transporter